MALVVNDRVKETSTTTGTGTFSLAGAVTGFETFVAGIGNSNTTYYAIVNTNNGEFEVGLGTVTDGTPDTLARTTIISSSNSDSAVDFSSGTKNVFVTLPASKSVILDSSGNIVANNGSNLTALNASNVASGTLSSDRLPTVPTTKGGTGLTSIGTANQVIAVNSGATALEYQTVDLQNLNADNLTSGTVPDARFPATLPALNGSALTNLDAANLATNLVPTARLGTGTASSTTFLAGDQTYKTITADITAVTAGDGLTGGGTTGDVTLNVGAGTGVTINSDDIAIGQDVATSASPTFAGLTTTADISFGDNDKAVFGAGSDLQIYHDSASNISFIEESGTSNLHIRGASIVLKSQVDNDDYIKCNENAAVELYYSNAKKLETTSSGATVTGTMTATTFSGSGASLTSIPNGALDNSAITINGTSTSLGGSINVGDITGVTAGTNLTGGGTTGSVTLNMATGGVGSGTYGSTANGTKIDTITVDAYGRVTAVATGTTGDILGVDAGTLLDGGGSSGTVTLNVDLSELSTSTTNGDGDYFVVVDTANAQRKLTKGNINISGFNNDANFSTTTGTVTSVGISPGTGLDAGGAITSSGNISVTLDLSELTDMTATMTGSDEFIVLDASNERRKAASEIGLSIFNNDAGFTTNVGDITGVTAGSGLTGGGSSGGVTLNVGAGTGINVAADSISVDVSDFMSNGSNDRVLTATGADTMYAEPNMTFDGTDLTIPRYIIHKDDTNCYVGFNTTDNFSVITGGSTRFKVTSSDVVSYRTFIPGANDTYDLGSSGNVWRNLYTGDLHLSNEAKSEGNAVDGTKGNWTIQEGEEHLYILNNKNGKKYKFKLEEM